MEDMGILVVVVVLLGFVHVIGVFVAGIAVGMHRFVFDAVLDRPAKVVGPLVADVAHIVAEWAAVEIEVTDYHAPADKGRESYRWDAEECPQVGSETFAHQAQYDTSNEKRESCMYQAIRAEIY